MNSFNRSRGSSRVFLPNARAFFVWHSRHGFEADACLREARREFQETLNSPLQEDFEMSESNTKPGILARIVLALSLLAAISLSGCATCTGSPDHPRQNSHVWQYEMRQPGGPSRG